MLTFPTTGIIAIMSGNKILFDGRINFGLWQVQVKNTLIQSGLHKVLKGNQTPKGKDSIISITDETISTTSKFTMRDEDWKDLDLRAASAI